MREIELQVKRQASPTDQARVESFRLQTRPGLNLVSALMMIRENPVTVDGEATSPIAWESSCLEETCGACAMLVNGAPRPACSTLLESLGDVVVVEPLRKFPVIRDLIVDRSPLFNNLKRILGWVDGVDLNGSGAGPRIKPELQQELYLHSRCMTCGICDEVCPIVAQGKLFLGPGALGYAHYFNKHPLGESLKKQRLDIITEKGGVNECDDDRSCQKACPKGIPIADVLKALKKEGQWSWF